MCSINEKEERMTDNNKIMTNFIENGGEIDIQKFNKTATEIG